jgi:UDP-2-acetamido-3-amino-2,3-dideoxy-glucuronate N-acetyltransferase
MAMIHETAEVSPNAEVGEGTRVWHHAQIREGARVGTGCILAKGVYVDRDVVIGDNVKIQNYALIYRGATLGDGVFVGPLACLANDRFPRAVTPEGEPKGDEDWDVGRVTVERGASIGAAAVVLTGVRIGEWAMVGAAALVTRDVPQHGLVLGTPARLAGYACRCGRRMVEEQPGVWQCYVDGLKHIPAG